MIVQDMLTGALHEVPEVSGYGEEFPSYGYYGEAPDVGYGYYGEPVEAYGEVYDGFGNPVGLPFLAPLAAKILPAVSNLIPGVSQLVSRFLPGAGGPAAPPIPGLPSLPGFPPIPGFPAAAGPPPFPFPAFPPPVPPGWMRPPPGYQGMAPRRRYMRCVSWPGPPGLVPVSAGQPQPVPPIMAAAAGPIGRRRFRRRR